MTTQPPTSIQVVDSEGKEIVRPDVISFIYQAVSAAQLVKLRKIEEDERAEGILESWSVSVTDRRAEFFPQKPLKSVDVYNLGEGNVVVSVNEYQQADRAPLRKDDSLKVDAKGHTIRRLYFICPSGQTAEVYVQGFR